ncbi:hypothetical protein GCM10009785_15590 [Brooklawnia cerclae]|uniref:FAD:protein FMN transferase n=1 Tax=Brooklawnia cerclae TaxID=349934 RepID=A0ABX0SIS1_9ACTN|nr:FAD:protein FMN transferase [Brooklawnia cerclae]NIH57871.1 thiamine biosynthesis lipoprotein [Brooklawnia cerclae]
MPPSRSAGAGLTFPTMGTLGHASWTPPGLDIGRQLHDRAGRIERRLTRFRDDSEITGLSTSWSEVSDDTAAVLAASEALRAQTNGHFTALLGRQTRAWEQVAAGSRPGVPGSSAAAGRIEVDGNRARLVAAPPRSVDLGAIAKGYAADQLRDLAVGLGAEDVLIGLGGSSIAVAGEPAAIGLASPWQGWETFGTLTLASGSLSVSADPGTPIQGGRRRSHVLDPATGAPAVTDLCAAVVCGADGMACEAFSTAYLAMGLDAAMRLDLRHPELDSVFMTVDGRVLASPRLTITAKPGVQEWLRRQRSGASR